MYTIKKSRSNYKFSCEGLGFWGEGRGGFIKKVKEINYGCPYICVQRYKIIKTFTDLYLFTRQKLINKSTIKSRVQLALMTFYEIEKFGQENPEETNSLNCSSWFPCSLQRHRRPVLWNNIFQEVFSEVYNSASLSCPIWVIYGTVQRRISLLSFLGNLWNCTTAYLSLVLSG